MNDIVSCYKLVGFINIYNVIPDFVYPVFSAHNKFYFQDGKTIFINKFYEIETDLINKIMFFKDLFIEGLSDSTIPKTFCRNSPSVYAYQENNEKYFMGDLVSFYNYINKQSDNDLIIDFLDENKPNYILANSMHIENWNCRLIKMSSSFFQATPLFNYKKDINKNFLTATYSYYKYNKHTFKRKYLFKVDDEHFKLDVKMNIKLYNTFCKLIDEYADICIDTSSENQKIEFVEKLLKKKKWLLSPIQYEIIVKKYSKNYLSRNKYAYAINHLDLKEENTALFLLNNFLMDVIEDKNINTFNNIYR